MNDAVESIAAVMPPGTLEGSAAWYGRDYQDISDWIYHLSAEEIEEIDTAVRATQAAGRDIIGVTRDNFELPTLGDKLRAVRDEVRDGRGFALIRGLPIECYTLREAATAYFGIGAHMGSARSQNSEGHVLGHVCDLGHKPKENPHQRGYRSGGPLDFHTDSTDIAALLTWRKSKSGGEGKIASSVTVYNEMLRRCPDLLRELFKPINRDRRGEIPEGMKPWWTMPVYQWHAGYLNSHFNYNFILATDRFEELPPMSDALREAFRTMMEICEVVHLSIDYEAGDIGLVNNHGIFHARGDYEEWPEADRRRYLLRLWLCPPDGRPLPESYAQRYGSVTPGDRGGIVCPATEFNAPLEPI